MHRFVTAALLSAALVGCAEQSGSVKPKAVAPSQSAQLAEGVELVTLKLPAMV